MSLPIAPLFAAAGGPNRLARALGFDDVDELYSRTNISHYGKDGVPWWRADELAAAINLHPLNVWGDAWLNESAPARKSRRFRRPRMALIDAFFEGAA